MLEKLQQAKANLKPIKLKENEMFDIKPQLMVVLSEIINIKHSARENLLHI
jgi:hypothetical protein